MANFTIFGTADTDMNALSHTFNFDGATYEDHGSTEFAINYGIIPATLIATGRDFAYGGDTIADSGTIERLTVLGIDDSPLYEISGIAIQAQQVYQYEQRLLQDVFKEIFAGKDRITGSDGDNLLNGHGDADVMRGRDGSDVYIVDNAKDRVFESANQGANDVVRASVSYKLQDIPTEGIEKLQLVGTKDVNATGSVFDNALQGNAGRNILSGLEGNDVLKGGGGADTFLFKEAVSRDRILDFAREDRIVLDDQLYQDFGYRGQLRANEFKEISAPGARIDQDDIILYDGDTGAVFYDFNGSTPGGRTHIITLANKADLHFDDIFIS